MREQTSKKRIFSLHKKKISKAAAAVGSDQKKEQEKKENQPEREEKRERKNDGRKIIFGVDKWDNKSRVEKMRVEIGES